MAVLYPWGLGHDFDYLEIMATLTAAALRFGSWPLLSYRKSFVQPRRSKDFGPIFSSDERRMMKSVRRGFVMAATSGGGGGSASDLDGNVKKFLQVSLWIAECVYVVWLFFLPYAPGDPIWAISQETVNSLLGLSLNFFLILPLSNSVGIHLMEAPILHPVSEGLFNLVIGWTFLFAPLLYSDKRRDRYKGSIDVLWCLQMFLTNTFLIPYMAIRLNDAKWAPSSTKLGSLMTKGASVVGVVGGLACLSSILWAVYGRGSFYGGLEDRLVFLQDYVGSERLAYAFIWDILLYSVFQPWLIGDNIEKGKRGGVMNVVRFFPVVGLVLYCLLLDTTDDPEEN